MSSQNTLVKRTSSSLLLSFLLLVTFVACNDGETKTSDETETATSSTTAASPTTGTTPSKPAAAAAPNQYPVLCISKAELESFYTAGVFKLVFNLTWIETEPLNPTLTVYKSRQNGQFIGGAVKTLDEFNQLWPIEGTSYLGNLELTHKYYRDTLEPKAEGKLSLQFIPVKSGDGGNRVTYKLLWGDCGTLPAQGFTSAQVAAATDQLNPCPPNQPGQ